jgi:hypothetical protein
MIINHSKSQKSLDGSIPLATAIKYPFNYGLFSPCFYPRLYLIETRLKLCNQAVFLVLQKSCP